MDIYLAGTDVISSVPMMDRNGNVLSVASINYYITDMSDTVVLPLTTLAGFVSGSSQATVLVPAIANVITDPPIASAITAAQIDQFNTREIRTIVLECILTSGNSVVIKASYGLEHPDPLIVGLNSFQTLPNGELIAMDIVGLNHWLGAAERDKIAAMITARYRICQLNFWLLNSNTNWGQDNMNYVPEGAYQTPYASAGQNNMFIFNGNLGLLTPTQYDNLPVRFRTALKYAQVAEADFLLGGDQHIQRRQDGLVLESIGETRQVYRNTKPIDLPVSKITLRYLSAFVTFAKRIGRG